MYRWTSIRVDDVACQCIHNHQRRDAGDVEPVHPLVSRRVHRQTTLHHALYLCVSSASRRSPYGSTSHGISSRNRRYSL